MKKKFVQDIKRNANTKNFGQLKQLIDSNPLLVNELKTNNEVQDIMTIADDLEMAADMYGNEKCKTIAQYLRAKFDLEVDVDMYNTTRVS